MAVSLRKESEQPPSLRVRTPEGTARILRAHFTRHNWKVAGLAVGTLLVSAAAWVLLYLTSMWMLVFGLAVFAPDWTGMPRGFGFLFVVVGVSATVYAWIDNRLTSNARPTDKKGLGQILVEFILLVPNMTLSVGGTLGAWQHLNDAELADAAALLHRLVEEKRVPVSSVRLEIPDPDTAMRVLFALQLTEIVDVRRDENEFWLTLSSLRPASLRLTRRDLANS